MRVAINCRLVEITFLAIVCLVSSHMFSMGSCCVNSPARIFWPGIKYHFLLYPTIFPVEAVAEILKLAYISRASFSLPRCTVPCPSSDVKLHHDTNRVFNTFPQGKLDGTATQIVIWRMHFYRSEARMLIRQQNITIITLQSLSLRGFGEAWILTDLLETSISTFF